MSRDDIGQNCLLQVLQLKMSCNMPPNVVFTCKAQFQSLPLHSAYWTVSVHSPLSLPSLPPPSFPPYAYHGTFRDFSCTSIKFGDHPLTNIQQYSKESHRTDVYGAKGHSPRYQPEGWCQKIADVQELPSVSASERRAAVSA